MNFFNLYLCFLVMAGMGLQAVDPVPTQGTDIPKLKLLAFVTDCNAEGFAPAFEAYRSTVGSQKCAQLADELEKMAKELIEQKVKTGGLDPDTDRYQERLGRHIRHQDIIYSQMGGFLRLTLAAAGLWAGFAGVSTAAIGLIPFKVYKGAGAVVIPLFNYSQRIKALFASPFCFITCVVCIYGMQKNIDHVKRLSGDIQQLDRIINYIHQA